MSQTQEDRMVRYFKSLKRNRDFQHGYRKGWHDGPHMQVARVFGVPIKQVKAVLEAKQGGTK